MIKKKWFDMILSGEKKEEYRDIKPFYNSRMKKKYKYIEFRCIYSKTSPVIRVKCLNITKGKGRRQWGFSDNDNKYIISLGDIVEKKNIK
jgi:hypothetical protein